MQLTKISLCFGLGLLSTVYSTHAHVATNGWPNDVIDAYDFPCQHNQDGFDGAEDCGTCVESTFGQPRWRVSEPYLTLWLHDVPSAYFPSQGPPIAVELTYKHRATYSEQGISSFGTNWGCRWFGYIDDYGDDPVYNAQGARFPFKLGALSNYKIGVYAQEVLGPGPGGQHIRIGFRIWFADGSYHLYLHKIYGNPLFTYRYLLKYAYDRHGFKTLEFRYGNNENSRVVTQIIDCDGKTNILSYAHSITNLVTSMQDPYGRLAQFQYDTAGRLTNIIDVVTNSSAIAYDASGLVTNLATPYGNTSFKITQSAPFQDPNNTNRWVALGGTNIINRSVEITQPDGSKQLYLYRDDSRKLNPSSGVDLLPASFPLPTTGSLSNKFEDNDLFY